MTTQQSEGGRPATYSTNKPFDQMTIRELARVILNAWPKPFYAAKVYIDAMLTLEYLHEPYGAESGRDIVTYFLANAGTWRGQIAFSVKAELNRRLKQK